MQVQLGKEYGPDQRIQFLKDNCDSAEEMSYMRRFEPEELIEMKESLSDLSIKLNEIEEERKEVAEQFKLREKPLKHERKRVLTGLKQKAEEVTENCFKFIDEETRTVGYYNKNGDLVHSRPAFGNELQGNIFKQNLKIAE